MRSTRVRRALIWTMGIALVTAPALATAPSADRASTIAAQLSAPTLDPAIRATLVDLARALEPYEAQVADDGMPPVDLRVWLRPSASAVEVQRVIEAARTALGVFAAWYGPFPYTQLVVIEGRWRGALVGASYPGAVVIGTHWIESARDMTPERALIGGIARQYAFSMASRTAESSAWFDEGLVLYSGARAVHQALEGRNPATVRMLGGHVPVVIRQIQWSPSRFDPRPRVRHFPELDEPASAAWRFSSVEPGSRAARAALALHTLERYIGWPAMQQALAGYRERASREGGSPVLFSTVVSEQRGGDVSWFWSDAFRSDLTFDYAVDRLDSDASSDAPNQYRTTVVVRRLGTAVFAGTSRPHDGEFGGRRAIPVRVTFDDGSIAEDAWDGRASSGELVYLSRSRARSASVDPDAVLLLDANRANNTRTLVAPFSAIGARLALHWIVWLQDLMMTCTSLA